MKSKTRNLLIGLLAAAGFIGLLLVPGNNRWLGVAAWILELVVLTGFGAYTRARSDALLDAMWAQADAKGLDAQQLSQFSDKLGALDLAATRRPKRTYYPSGKVIRAIMTGIEG